MVVEEISGVQIMRTLNLSFDLPKSQRVLGRKSIRTDLDFRNITLVQYQCTVLIWWVKRTRLEAWQTNNLA